MADLSITADLSSVTSYGIDVSLLIALGVETSVSEFTTVAYDSGFNLALNISGVKQEYVVTGSTAVLNLSLVIGVQKIDYLLTANDSSFGLDLISTKVSQSYLITSVDTILTYTQHYFWIETNTGEFVLSTVSAVFHRSTVLSGTTKSLTVSNPEIVLDANLANRVMSNTVMTYTLDFSSVSLFKALKLTTEQQSVLIEFVESGLLKSLGVACTTKAFTITPKTVVFRKSLHLVSEVLGLTITVLGSGLSVNYRIAGTKASFIITRVGASLIKTLNTYPAVKDLTITGKDVSFRIKLRVTAVKQTYFLSLIATGIVKEKKLLVPVKRLTIIAYPITTRIALKTYLDTKSFFITTYDSSLKGSLKMAVSRTSIASSYGSVVFNIVRSIPSAAKNLTITFGEIVLWYNNHHVLSATSKIFLATFAATVDSLLDYYAVMTENYSCLVNNIRTILPVNERYELVQQYVEVQEGGSIAFYHQIFYNGTLVMVPEDYCVVVRREYMQQDKTMRERMERELTDPITNYQDAYEEYFNIRTNPYCDVDRTLYQESE